MFDCLFFSFYTHTDILLPLTKNCGVSGKKENKIANRTANAIPKIGVVLGGVYAPNANAILNRK